jgi:hypothetical protein
MKPKDDGDDDKFFCSARCREPTATGQSEARPTFYDRRSEDKTWYGTAAQNA